MPVTVTRPRYGGAFSPPAEIVPGVVLGTRGNLTVRLARDAADIDAAQHLRYRVFYEELDARPDLDARKSRRDRDSYDSICDHLLVMHRGPSVGPGAINLPDGELVGTYRLLRQSVAEQAGGFYTQGEFDIAPLIRRHPRLDFLELGRSCVLQPYRTKPVVELLWQGIWNYVRLNDLDVMLGCASLEGTDPARHDLPLTYMARHCAAPPDWHVSALAHRRVEMDRLPHGKPNAREALRQLPPLIKGYLRLGSYIGDGAVIDEQFNTIDVLIILPVSAINPRYFSHFGAPDEEPITD